MDKEYNDEYQEYDPSDIRSIEDLIIEKEEENEMLLLQGKA